MLTVIDLNSSLLSLLFLFLVTLLQKLKCCTCNRVIEVYDDNVPEVYLICENKYWPSLSLFLPNPFIGNNLHLFAIDGDLATWQLSCIVKLCSGHLLSLAMIHQHKVYTSVSLRYVSKLLWNCGSIIFRFIYWWHVSFVLSTQCSTYGRVLHSIWEGGEHTAAVRCTVRIWHDNYGQWYLLCLLHLIKKPIIVFLCCK